MSETIVTADLLFHVVLKYKPGLRHSYKCDPISAQDTVNHLNMPNETRLFLKQLHNNALFK